MTNKIEIPRTMTEVMQDIDYNTQLLDLKLAGINETSEDLIKNALITDITQLRSQLNSLEVAIQESNLELALNLSRPRRVKREAK